MAKAKTVKELQTLEQYQHDDTRKNSPHAGIGDYSETNDKKIYQYNYDVHLHPYLNWASKEETTQLEIDTVSLHVHEKIDPVQILKATLNEKTDPLISQDDLFFNQEDNQLSTMEAIETYQHEIGWTNRLIAGDSRLVMNSLIEKEQYAGKVQMIYFDPPYGIKYGSNFQPFTNKKDVKDGNDADLSKEVEVIKAFRDTWELGIHSYLNHLRDRLTLARELLAESGSCFVQISDENVHLVRCIMDEVFGHENFVSMITYRTSANNTSTLRSVSDYVLWYSKNLSEIKFNRLYTSKTYGEDSTFTSLEFNNGFVRGMTKEEKLNPNIINSLAKPFRTLPLHSQGEGDNKDFYFRKKFFSIPKHKHWRTKFENLPRLEKANRIIATENTVSFLFYFKDFPYSEYTTTWEDTGPELSKSYVVQTSTKVIERCMLMTTDPSDLVLDISCGSGTTAFVAEKWGRRWITCDTSRVAITLAKQRLLTACFDYYQLKNNKNLKDGFVYKTVPHITLKSIANNPEIDTIYEKHQPEIQKALSELNQAWGTQFEEWEVPHLPDLDMNNRLDMNVKVINNPEIHLGVGDINSNLDVNNRLDVNTPLDMNVKVINSPEVHLGAGDINSNLDVNNRLDMNVKVINNPEIHLGAGDINSNLDVNNRLDVNNCLDMNVKVINNPEIYLGAGGVNKNPDMNVGAIKDVKYLIKFWKLKKARQMAIDHSIDKRAEQEILYDQPEIDRKKQRVSSPFTVEAVPSYVVKNPTEIIEAFQSDENNKSDGLAILNSQSVDISKDGESARLSQWKDLLLSSGINGKSGKRLRFNYLNWVENTETIHLIGEISNDQNESPMIGIASFGPAYAPYSDAQLKSVLNELPHIMPKPKFVFFIGFSFDPIAKTNISEIKPIGPFADIEFLTVEMNQDLLVRDLKKQQKQDQLFWFVGEPDAKLIYDEKSKRYHVEVYGYDYFDLTSNELKSASSKDIAMWLLDSNYDGLSINPKQIFFPNQNTWDKLAKTLKAQIDIDRIKQYHSTKSLPFELKPFQKVAIKIIDNRGIESVKILTHK